MKTTLLIMAAGIGSRLGTGIKQLEPVDASNHIIMDYSIHDATVERCVVFIIPQGYREGVQRSHRRPHCLYLRFLWCNCGLRFPGYQRHPGGLCRKAGQSRGGLARPSLQRKMWIDTPFIVINADDYYGKEGFKAVHEYLVNGGKSCMAGFVLKNTLSDNGGVTRGIYKMDEQNNLTEVVETKNIVKTADGAEADGCSLLM